MKKHLQTYYKILSIDFPDFLNEYCEIPELKRIDKIGMNCGTDYTKLFDNLYFYSRYDHSIAVALIIWNFTRDKTQTIAGLLHDIATPSFSHCIDFLNKDYMVQESTESETNTILNSSRELRSLLQRDGIPMELICDYKIYPIADNPTPQLSADRLEYTLSSGMTFTRQWSVNDIQRLYSDIKVFKNEYNAAELGFKTRNIAEEFISGASKMWYVFMSSKDKLVMQFLADIIKCLTKRNIMDESGIYTLSESEIIDLALNSGFDDLAGTMISFQNSVQIFEGDSKPIRETSYCIDVVPKKRYINPMINGIRSTGVSQAIRNIIKEFTDYSAPRYCWFDFDVPKSLFF